MLYHLSTLSLLLASTTTASPILPRQNTFPTTPAPLPAWNAGSVPTFPIHASCNATQRTMLQKGLNEALTLVGHARDHILRFGNSSELYTKYFGDAPTGEPIGWYTKLADGDKAGILFRCDDIDGNCGQAGWAGHWRGANATQETVICDLSYEIRKPLEAMCMHGYDVANGATNTFWASDLVHRLLHVPSVGEGVVEHYIGEEGGEKYPGVMKLAKENATFAARDSDALQYFALEAYAYDVAVPGIGCSGTYRKVEEVVATSSTAAGAAATSEAVGVPTEACEPHGDHWHCPPGVPVPTAPPAATSAEASATSEAAAVPTEACEPHGDHWHCPPGVPVPTSPPA